MRGDIVMLRRLVNILSLVVIIESVWVSGLILR